MVDNSPADDAQRQVGIFERYLIQLLLLLTLFVAYLNPVLRASEESILTGYRVILPFVTALLFIRFLRRPVTHRFIGYLAVVLAYSLAQMAIFGHLTNPFVWSYLLNTLGLIAFVYFVYLYRTLFGIESLFRHLYFWYTVLVLASVHQLLTGFRYPNAPYHEGAASIHYGQYNDASLAIAAFLPILLARCRRDPIAVLLLGVGLYVLYINNTRGVLVAVATYPVLLAAAWIISRIGGRVGAVKAAVAVIVPAVVAGFVLNLLADVPIELRDETSTLREMVIAPLGEIFEGEEMTAELTSINLRVTLAVVGLQKLASTLGFGVGPGASTYFVQEYYQGIALSMHVFPLQLWVENGWLFIGTMAWIIGSWGPRIGWARFIPLIIFYTMVSSSITSGAITNYYYHACLVFAVTALRFAHWSRGRHSMSVIGKVRRKWTDDSGFLANRG